MTEAFVRSQTVAGTRARGDLFEALRARRSRRVGAGMPVPDGALAYDGGLAPRPLSEEETATLVFAASGFTGGALLDWNWGEGSGGTMMANIRGRTVPSADAGHMVALFVIDDDGAWLMPRPQDVSSADARAVLELTDRGDLVGAWRAARIRVADRRPQPSLDFPYNVEANRWSMSAPGTTTFLPVVESSFQYINVLLELLSESTGISLLDDRRLFLPAGLRRFSRSRGGHLEDDARTLKTMPIVLGERLIEELGCVEVGAMIQSLYLAAETMGLGGFSHYAMTDFGAEGRTWFDELGFTTREMPISRFLGVPSLARLVLKARRQDVAVRFPVALEVEGRPVLRSFQPPNFPTMRDAVLAVAAHKRGSEGTLTHGAGDGRWRDPTGFAASVPDLSEAGIEATIAYAEYVWKRYGRFPAHIGAFHTLVAFQASHPDAAFYDTYYRDALTPMHRDHDRIWHDGGGSGIGTVAESRASE